MANNTIWTTGSAEYQIEPTFRGGQISLLLAGTSLDGPSNEVVRVSDVAEIDSWFGGYSYDRISISASATGAALSGTPLTTGSAHISAYRYVNNELVSLQMPDLTIANATGGITFKPLGAALSGDIIFRYRHSYSESDLVPAFYAAQVYAQAPNIHVLRVARPEATGSLGNITLEATHAGALYNQVKITVSSGGDSAEFRLPPGMTNEVISYSVPAYGTIAQLVAQINSDAAIGRNVVKAWTTSPGDTTITATGITYLAGGSDTVMTLEDLQNAIRNLDLSSVDVICPLGVAVEDFYTFLSSNIFATPDGPPTMFVLTAPKISGAATGDYVSALTTAGSGYQSNYVYVSANEGLFSIDGYSYWADTSPVLAGVLSREPFTATQKPVALREIRPAYTRAQMLDITTGGYVVFYQSIGQDMVVWQSRSTAGRWSTGTLKALQQVYHRIFNAFEQYIGENFITLNDVDTTLDTLLSSIPYVQDIKYRSGWDGETLSISVDLLVYGEIQYVSAMISVRPKNLGV